jgi:hypothetical protein
MFCSQTTRRFKIRAWLYLIQLNDTDAATPPDAITAPWGQPITQFLHSYNARGDLGTLTERSKGKSFVYDVIERLIDVMQTSVAAPFESYAYDTEAMAPLRISLPVKANSAKVDRPLRQEIASNF